MARKTAMGKEPGNVSIAIPESEKQRLREAGKRLPGKVRDVPNMAERLAKDAKPTPLKRLSPGVYRNGAGQLVGSKGQALGRSSPIQNALQGAGQAAGQQAGMQANMQGIVQAAGMEGGRMPAGRPGQQMSQQEIDAAMQAGNLAQSIMDQYKVPGIGNQSGQMIGNMQMPNYGDARTLTPQERAARGIDPRDPNIYSIMPNGQVMSTLMGWSPNPQGLTAGQMFGNMAPQNQPQAPAQPNSISGLLRRGR